MTSGAASIRGDFSIGGKPVFSGVSIEIEAGRWTCLLGPSGVGKSTILRLLAGLETGGRFEGEITDLEGRAALMAQSDLLAPWLDVLGNVTLGARLRRERPDLDRARHLIEAVGLGAHIRKHPRELSGGMRQRAALARTLMEDRPFILLDEPFSALDAATRAQCQELAFELLKDRTVLLVTHDPGEAARLGHAIHVMSAERGAERFTPGGTPCRAIGDADMKAAEIALYERIRAA